MSEKARKNIFFIMTCAAFLAVFIYEYLTPFLSDDIIYYDEVARAGNFFDLFSQEFNQYMTHTGRSVSHIILRIFLFVGPKVIFDAFAAAVFVGIALLIYLNVYNRKEYDARLFGFVLVMLWFFDAVISHTVFWEDGACNYMFTGAIMLGFMTLYRLGITGKRNPGTPAAIYMLLLGILAGWCNENTSGGVILFVLIELFYHFFKNKKKWSFVKPWMITGLAGNIVGFLLMVAAPGNYGRLGAADEEHTGLLALAARFLKITIAIQENYLVLLCMVVACLIFIWIFASKGEFFEKAKVILLFLVLFFATSYALIMVPSSELRSYYGAFLFMVIALSNGFAQLLALDEELITGALTSFVAIFGIIFVFSYLSDGANLARINREFKEREEYCISMKQQGITDVTVPMLRPDWETRFSAAYEMDIQEDPGYWINYFYSVHYGLGSMTGVSREEWTEY